MKTVIIGGGISGLAAAFYLIRQQPLRRIVLLEASPRFGGIIRSQEIGGFCLEAGPDGFLRQKRHAAELCRQLGLEAELIPNRLENQISYCWLNGELHPFPRLLNPPIDLDELSASPLLSESGRQRACREPEVAPGSGQEETVASFIARRFGSEVAERLFEPITAGVFGGSASEISLSAAFPRLLDYELQHGRLSAAMDTDKAVGKSADSVFLSLRKGMGQMPARLVETLRGRAELHPAAAVSSVVRSQGGFGVMLPDGSSIQTDSVVLATSAPHAARLLQAGFESIADPLSQIEYAPSILVCLGYGQEVVRRPGSGWIAPPAPGKNLLACTWAHQKFERRCPPDHSLLRAYLDGNSASRLLQAEDQEIIEIARRELREIQGVTGSPILERVYRLPSALPLYRLGHLDLVRRIQRSLKESPGLFCIGNYLDGVGIPDCLRQAQSAASRISQLPREKC